MHTKGTSPRIALGFAAAALLWLGGAAGVDAAELVFDGILSPSDLVMPSDGTYYKMYEFSAQEGDEITVDLMSSDFDSFLLVHSPGGGIHMDDDGGEGLNSRFSITADQSGTWKAFANTVGQGETGRYQLRVKTIPAGEFQTQTFSGNLGSDSPRRPDNNAPYTEHTLSFQAGQEIVIGLDSDSFDAMLFVHSPSGESHSDDDGGDGTNSRLAITTDQAGTWRIVATAYNAEAEGPYTLTVRTRNPGAKK